MTKKTASNFLTEQEKLLENAHHAISEIDYFQYYLELAGKGQYPLFFRDWVMDVIKDENKIKHNKRKLSLFFKKLEKHKNLDRKKVSLCSMSEKERKQFIQLFYKAVENETLKSQIYLH